MGEEIQSLLKEAQALFNEQHWDAAINAYQKIMGIDPQNDEACNKLAEIYAIRGLISKVINQYFTLMDILEAKGELAAAIDVSLWIERIQPENVDTRQRRIAILRKKDDKAKVEEDSLKLSHLYIKLGYGEKSIVLLKQLQEDNPDNMDIGLQLAEMYLSYGYIQEGVAQFRKNAQILMEQGELAKAAEAFKRMKVAHSEDQELLFTLGNLYFKLGKLDDAESEYRAILRYNLNNLEVLIALGCVCQQKGNFQDAKLAFRKILSINPQDIIAKEKLGEIFQAENQLSEAIKNYLAAAHSYQLGGEAEKATKLYRRVLVLDPTNPTATRELTNLGVSFEAENEEDLAIPQPLIKPAAKLLEEHGQENATDEESSFSLKPKFLKPLIPKASLFKDRAPRVSGLMPKPGLFKPTAEEGKAALSFSQALEKPKLNWKPLLSSKKKIDEAALIADEKTVPIEVPGEQALESIVEQVPEEPIIAVEPLAEEGVIAEPISAQEPEPIPFNTEEQVTVTVEPLAEEGVVAEPISAQEPEPIPFNTEEQVTVAIEPLAEEGVVVEPISAPEPEPIPFNTEKQVTVAIEPLAEEGVVAEPISAQEPEPIPFNTEEQVTVAIEPLAEEGVIAEPISAPEPEPTPFNTEEQVTEEPIVNVEQPEGLLPDESAVAVELPPEETIVSEEILTEEPQPEQIKAEIQAGEETITMPEQLAEPQEAALPNEEKEERQVSNILQELVGRFISIPIEDAPEPSEAITIPKEPIGFASLEPKVISTAVKEPIEAEAVSFEQLSEYLLNEDIGKAILAFQKHLNENPQNNEIRFKLAKLALDYGIQDIAENELAELINQAPMNSDYHELQIQLYLLSDKQKMLGKSLYTLAQQYETLNSLDKLSSLYQDILALEPENITAREALAQIYLKQNLVDAALYHYRKTAELLLTNEVPEEAIRIYRKILELKADILTLEKLSQIYVEYNFSNEAVTELFKLGDFYIDKHLWPKAIKAFEQIASLSPKNIVAHEKLADLYQKIGNLEGHLQEKYIIGNLYSEEQNVAAAQKIYEELLKERSDFYEVRRKLVDIYLAVKEEKRAIREAQILSEVYFEKKKFDAAINLYETLVNGISQDLSLREKLMQFYMLKGERENAIREMLTIGQSYEENNAWEDAGRIFKKGLSVDDRNPLFHYHLAKFYAEFEKNYSEAVKEFEQVFELTPHDKEAMEYYARFLLKNTKIKELVELLNRLATTEPSYLELKNTLINEIKQNIAQIPDNITNIFILGNIYRHLEMIDEAIEQFQIARKTVDYRLPSYNMLGLCFAAKPGKSMFDTAVKQFNKGIEDTNFSEEEKIELIYNLAMIYENSGQLSEALQYYNRVLAIDINYRDIKQKIHQLEEEISGSSKIRRLRQREAGD